MKNNEVNTLRIMKGFRIVQGFLKSKGKCPYEIGWEGTNKRDHVEMERLEGRSPKTGNGSLSCKLPGQIVS